MVIKKTIIRIPYVCEMCIIQVKIKKGPLFSLWGAHQTKQELSQNTEFALFRTYVGHTEICTACYAEM